MEGTMSRSAAVSGQGGNTEGKKKGDKYADAVLVDDQDSKSVLLYHEDTTHGPHKDSDVMKGVKALLDNLVYVERASAGHQSPGQCQFLTISSTTSGRDLGVSQGDEWCVWLTVCV